MRFMIGDQQGVWLLNLATIGDVRETYHRFGRSFARAVPSHDTSVAADAVRRWEATGRFTRSSDPSFHGQEWWDKVATLVTGYN